MPFTDMTRWKKRVLSSPRYEKTHFLISVGFVLFIIGYIKRLYILVILGVLFIMIGAIIRFSTVLEYFKEEK